MALRREPSGIRKERRMPEADSTRYAAAGAPADEYGCQTWSRSKAIARSKSAVPSAVPSTITAHLSVDGTLRRPAARQDLHLHPPTALAAEPRRFQREGTLAGGVVRLLLRPAAAAAPRPL